MTITSIVSTATVAVVLLVLPAHGASAHQDHKPRAEKAATDVAQPVVPDPPPARSHRAEVPPQALAWFGKFHPPLTHFPVALIMAAALAEFLFVRRGGALFDHAVRFSVWLGAGAALPTAVLGWFFAGFRLIDDEWVMTAHRWTGTATAVCAAVLLWACERAYRGEGSRKAFRLVLSAATVFVAATGFLGGSLLYGLDHYAWGTGE